MDAGPAREKPPLAAAEALLAMAGEAARRLAGPKGAGCLLGPAGMPG